METVRHHGRETAYRVGRPESDGPTVLYVHGSGATHRVWAHQYGPDGPAHPAVSVDLSGHAASEDIATAAGRETLAAYADDVCAVARETDAAVLVGNSMGGAVVLWVLLERSLSVDGAVLAGSGAKLGVADHLKETLRSDFEGAVEWLHGPDRLFHDADARTVERSTETMQRVGQSVTTRDFLTCDAFDVRDRLGGIPVSVLAIVGEHDGLTPPSYHEYLARALPDCRCATIAGAAHLSMLERPAAFGDAIERFLADM